MWAALILPLFIVSIGISVAFMVHGFPKVTIHKHYKGGDETK